jgi:hypothetical protein
MHYHKRTLLLPPDANQTAVTPWKDSVDPIESAGHCQWALPVVPVVFQRAAALENYLQQELAEG